MAPEVLKKRAATATCVIIAVIGMLLPAVVAVIVALTTDTPLRTANAGHFVSSSASGGAFFVRPVTTIQTSTSSVVVTGRLSAVKRQRLEIVDRLKSGLHLCVQSTPPTCIEIEGQWTGQLKPVEHEHQMFAWLAARFSIPLTVLWLLFGSIALVFAVCLLASAGGWAPDEDLNGPHVNSRPSPRAGVHKE